MRQAIAVCQPTGEGIASRQLSESKASKHQRGGVVGIAGLPVPELKGRQRWQERRRMSDDTPSRSIRTGHVQCS